MGDVAKHGDEPAVGVVDEDEIRVIVHKLPFDCWQAQNTPG